MCQDCEIAGKRITDTRVCTFIAIATQTCFVASASLQVSNMRSFSAACRKFGVPAGALFDAENM